MKSLNSSKKNHESILNASIIFFVFVVVISLMNYLYQVFMGRMLGPVDYGILGSLFAIIYIVNFSSNTFIFVISKNIARYKAKNQKSKIKFLFKKLLSEVVILGLFLLIIFIFLTPYIARFMKLDNYFGITLVGLIAYLSLISVVFTGALNGLQKFIWQNLVYFISSLFKLLLAMILVFFGFKTNGALGAILIGILISLFFAYIPLRKELKTKEEKIDSFEIYHYAIFVFIASLLFVFIITLDQILVKHFFSSEYAGIYAAAGMIGKIIFFSTSFFIGPFFPKIVSLKSAGMNTTKLFRNVLFYVFIIASFEILAFFLFPNVIINLLYGKNYTGALNLVGIFGLSLGIFSLIQVFMTYDLAVEKLKFIYIFIIGVLFEVITIIFIHNTLIEIAKIVLATNLFILAGFILYNHKEVLNL
ncbi:MAG: oligosaccharide flippase family protein [Nanoarchaeota archaeon]|nr:oligosaccharide flippase family protein [Nanoarchaeota archaeon]